MWSISFLAIAKSRKIRCIMLICPSINRIVHRIGNSMDIYADGTDRAVIAAVGHLVFFLPCPTTTRYGPIYMQVN